MKNVMISLFKFYFLLLKIFSVVPKIEIILKKENLKNKVVYSAFFLDLNIKIRKWFKLAKTWEKKSSIFSDFPKIFYRKYF